MRILVIEDDLEAADYMRRGLSESGHVVDHAADGEEGYALAAGGGYDVLVVDRMLPKMDGLSVVNRLRAEGIDEPILFLSALGDVDDRVKGLKTGGDDYLVKPYAFAELLARIEALVRRRNPEQVETQLSVADLEMDLLSRRVKRARSGAHPAAPGVPAPGVSHAPCRPDGDADHAAGERLGLPFRSPDQRYRCPYQPVAGQDRQGLRPATAPYGPGGGVLSS